MSPEVPITKEFDSTSLFLSEITGLSVDHCKKFPQLDALGPDFVPSSAVPFTYDLTLGKDGNEYKLNFTVLFTDEWSPHEWLPSTKWNLTYNDEEISKVGGSVNCSKQLYSYDFKNRQKVESFINDEVGRYIGGPDTEFPFMDYEAYSFESLGKEQSYFRNIYLLLMTHMKERGLVMPPILSKRDYIREPMEAGNVKKVNQLLSSVIAFEGQNYPMNVRAHMKRESHVIQEHASSVAKQKDPKVPLEEAFHFLNIKKIDKGQSILPAYTILAVENDLDHYGHFSDAVVGSMEQDGRFKGSKVVMECNLSSCMQLCESNRIDVVIFDWSNPSVEEVLMVRSEETNPFYQMFHGTAQAALTIGEDGITASRSDGKFFDKEEMKKEAEEVDIRNRWMDMIADACRKKNVEPPSHFIIRSQLEFRDISKIIAQKLGK